MDGNKIEELIEVATWEANGSGVLARPVKADLVAEASSDLAAMRWRIAELEGALERIAAGNPGRPKWLTDIEMADIARAALDSR